MKPLRIGLVLLAAIVSITYASAALSGKIACENKIVPTKPMTFTGPNFSAYCLPCVAALRTYGRVPVIDSVTAAFADLEQTHPDAHFIYGEVGFPDGGQFKPHRTHREGKSVDIMVPMQDGRLMTTNVTNRFGYDVEFDDEGKGDGGEIDFTALGSLILAIKEQAQKLGGDIDRIFFAPDLQPKLEASTPGILSEVQFNSRQSWVRHDDHIHIDFRFSCDE